MLRFGVLLLLIIFSLLSGPVAIAQEVPTIYASESKFDTAYYEEYKFGCSWYCSIRSGNIVVTASSELPPTDTIAYKAQNAHDHNSETAWVAGGDGIGEYLEFKIKVRPNSKLTITGFDIFNGYVKNEVAWRENSRVKKLQMLVNDEPFAILVLHDSRFLQNFHFDAISLAGREVNLKFKILEVYPGDKYADTAVSEIEFFGGGHH